MYIIDYYSHEYKTRRILDLDKILLVSTKPWCVVCVVHKRHLDVHICLKRMPQSQNPGWSFGGHVIAKATYITTSLAKCSWQYGRSNSKMKELQGISCGGAVNKDINRADIKCG